MILKMLDCQFLDDDFLPACTYAEAEEMLHMPENTQPGGVNWRLPSMREMRMISTLAELGVGNFRNLRLWTSSTSKSHTGFGGEGDHLAYNPIKKTSYLIQNRDSTKCRIRAILHEE